ncbi:AAA family ATPase [Catellatospora sp. NPDC049111]|uniref:AAA family ATPase n=1 Tax=Catellatospora sp. NPDC049111 TaxID=3155271 RepID=UPI0033D2B05E
MPQDATSADRTRAEHQTRGPGAQPHAVHKPTLVIVSGRPGSGKTTLARQLAHTFPCPLVSRDELNEGIFHTFGHDLAATSKDTVAAMTFTAFFNAVDLLLSARVTIVAEAAFQHHKWSLGLASISAVANLRVVHCVVDPDVAVERVAGRRQRLPDTAAAQRAASARSTAPTGPGSGFEPLSLAVPTLSVDTTDGYEPSLEQILTFARDRPGE